MKWRLAFYVLVVIASSSCQSQCKDYCSKLYTKLTLCGDVAASETQSQYVGECMFIIDKMGTTGAQCQDTWSQFATMDCETMQFVLSHFVPKQ